MGKINSVLILLLALMVALPSCRIRNQVPQQTAPSEFETVYQAPLRTGEAGRVVHRKNSTHAAACGDISPSYVWIQQVSKLYGMPIDLNIRDLRYFERRSADPAGRYTVDPHANMIEPKWMWDYSWMEGLSESWRPGIDSSQWKSFQRFSIEDAECWARQGDQLSLLAISSYHSSRSFDLERLGKIEASRAEFFKELEALLSAAAVPDPACVADGQVSESDTDDRCYFLRGVPHANYMLSFIARRETDLVVSGKLEAPETYFERAVIGGHGSAYYAWFHIVPLTL